MSFIIITQQNKAIEYKYTNIDECLNKYIEEERGFERGFSMNINDWEKVLEKQNSLTLKINILNSLCKRKSNGITKILTDYDHVLPAQGYDRYNVYYKTHSDSTTAYAYVDSSGTIPTGISVAVDDNFDGLPVTSISRRAFYNNISLHNIVLPNSIESIGYEAFSDCSSLQNIVLPNKLSEINRGTFNNCRSLNNIIIPQTVSQIGSDAFKGCSSLTSITLPDQISSIDGDTFHGCSGLTSITIPEGITSIGPYAFAKCRSLTSIEIPAAVKLIGGYAFAECSSLTNIVIPESVSHINEGTFFKCIGLKTITIPGSVKYVHTDAFINCTFDEIRYAGTSLMWNNISFESGNTAVTNPSAPVVYNYKNTSLGV